MDQLVSFLQTAFEAEVVERLTTPDGATRHTQLRIGDSMITMGPARDDLCVYERHAAYQQVLAAGATSMMEPSDQFYGDRNAGVQDPQGNLWWIATHVERCRMKKCSAVCTPSPKIEYHSNPPPMATIL